MSDYIKREDALDIVADNNVTGEITLNRYDKIIDGIYDISSADVVPVVRCKDCVSFHYSGMGGDNGITYCAKGIEMQPTDFCSYGERKDDE